MQGQQHFGLPLPAKARKTDNLAPAGNKSAARQRQYGRTEINHMPRTHFARGAAHGGDEAGGIKSRCRAFRHDSGILHHDDTVRGFQHLMQDMRDQDHRTARCHKAAHMGQKLGGKPDIQRRGGFVKDHQPRRDAGIGKGHGNLDHLAAGDRQRADRGQRINAMTGEHGIQGGGDDAPCPLPPPEPAKRGMHDPGILGHGQVRAKRQFLKHAAQATGTGGADAPGPALAIGGDTAALQGQPAIDHADQRRFPGPVMADQPDTFALPHRQRHPVQCRHFAKADACSGHLDHRRGAIHQCLPSARFAVQGEGRPLRNGPRHWRSDGVVRRFIWRRRSLRWHLPSSIRHWQHHRPGYWQGWLPKCPG